jgi:hypothetical protein
VPKNPKPEDSKITSDRVSIDVSDLRSRIENCGIDDSWHEIPFSRQCRIALKRGLDQMEKEKEIAKKNLDA